MGLSMRRSEFEKLAIAAVAVGGIAGCGGAPEGPVEDSDSQSYAVVCGYSRTMDADGQPNTIPEMYVVTAMNRKLRLHPDLASSFGRQTVEDCDGARRFMAAY